MKTSHQLIFWLFLSLGATGYFAQSLVLNESHPDFLPGETSHGHYQIELACESCHTEPFGSEKIIQNACLNCHKQELNDANDSHPIKKFTDPRNADRLAILDARYCVSCHKEHVPQQTRDMGVTLPDDFCEACHEDIAKERPSHEGMAFDTCASSGCHNYHDNKALYESFLLKHSSGPETKPLSTIAEIIEQKTQMKQNQNDAGNAASTTNDQIVAAEFPSHISVSSDTLDEWQHSAHASYDVNCMDCHSDKATPNTWIEKPALAQCQSCHTEQADGFKKGKHGMRLGTEIDGSPMAAMTVGESKLFSVGKMQVNAADAELTCTSCHSDHNFDPIEAATQACLGCHNDEHSLSFESSKHHLTKDSQGQSFVTCATCHLPNTEIEVFGKKKHITQHNQNHNFKPNEKMIRTVCLDCHSLGFAIDALADEALINQNFQGQPSIHIKSIDMALDREKK